MRLSIPTFAIGCGLCGSCAALPGADDTSDIGTLIIFHNGTGPMCLEALAWLEGAKREYPTLAVEEHLTYEVGELAHLAELEARFEASEGVSTSFEYLPVMFFREHAYSGFNDDIAEALQEFLSSEGDEN